MKKGVVRNFTKFTWKHLCQNLFFNEVAGLWHKCFPVNFVKFLRAPFLQNSSGRLLFQNFCQTAKVDAGNRILKSSIHPQKQKACNFVKKESLAQVFYCDFCQISKNIFFTEHLRWLLLYRKVMSVSAGLITRVESYLRKLQFINCLNY